MKITILEKKIEEPKTLYARNVPIGFVFEILEGSSPHGAALKIEDNIAVLLTCQDRNDWLKMINIFSYWDSMPIRILGRLEEIIVQQV